MDVWIGFCPPNAIPFGHCEWTKNHHDIHNRPLFHAQQFDQRWIRKRLAEHEQRKNIFDMCYADWRLVNFLVMEINLRYIITFKCTQQLCTLWCSAASLRLSSKCTKNDRNTIERKEDWKILCECIGKNKIRLELTLINKITLMWVAAGFRRSSITESFKTFKESGCWTTELITMRWSLISFNYFTLVCRPVVAMSVLIVDNNQQQTLLTWRRYIFLNLWIAVNQNLNADYWLLH